MRLQTAASASTVAVAASIAASVAASIASAVIPGPEGGGHQRQHRQHGRRADRPERAAAVRLVARAPPEARAADDERHEGRAGDAHGQQRVHERVLRGLGQPEVLAVGEPQRGRQRARRQRHEQAADDRERAHVPRGEARRLAGVQHDHPCVYKIK